jgi:hypothetical protein
MKLLLIAVETPGLEPLERLSPERLALHIRGLSQQPLAAVEIIDVPPPDAHPSVISEAVARAVDQLESML